ncbi:hypothetical protein AWL63_23650 (plasmid) [Sphingomonas panacis]|uniref:DUF302 domain-containing protein n=1 Tax=Sphingomonas panacis TaxID=1560345 RepID=A0A1B3ZIA7_9SPHN|nr:DUF302 domain-containing protein [Sphingomonas panacis]AOH87166.1 hypothetical protein AWL63_23650 [Sphingomonas panacis]
MIKAINVEHREHVSQRTFEDVLASFMDVTGSVEDGFDAVAGALSDRESFERAFKEREGSSGFMRFAVIDHGAWLTRIYDRPTKAVMVILGNPLIAITMLRHHTGAGLNVPVRIYLYEDTKGRTLVSYDLPSSLMSSLEDDAVMAAARFLDARLMALATMIAGVEA